MSARAKILEALECEDIDYLRAAEIAGVSTKSSGALMGRLHEAKLVHVVDYKRAQFQPRKVFRLGPGKDKPAPPPMTPAERNRVSRARRPSKAPRFPDAYTASLFGYRKCSANGWTKKPTTRRTRAQIEADRMQHER